jgi:light-regulated signal transduction histidine kinase (bacteriophytochrome)
VLDILASFASGALASLRAHQELEGQVAARTSELVAANQELEAFSYSVSHDLRAPLRSIDGYSQALLEDCGPELGVEARAYLARIRAGAQRMGQLIDDLLQLSKVTRAPLSSGTVDLAALARETAEALGAAEPSRDVELVVADVLPAQGDARLLRVVIENLLSNAWKFTRDRSRARVELGMEIHDGEPAYFVRDNGAGFASTGAGKLFRPFQRLHSERKFEGNGVGLSVVQRIVRRHGGRVWAEGAPERGATFWFTLRRARDPAAEEGGSRAPENAPLG